jgi:hypothetical protein
MSKFLEPASTSAYGSALDFVVAKVLITSGDRETLSVGGAPTAEAQAGPVDNMDF